MGKKTTQSTQYFAAIENPDQLASEMMHKIRAYREWLGNRGLIQLWQKKLSNYYGISANGNSSHGVSSGGSEGELTLIKVNDLHNLIQGQLTMVTSQRPAGIAKATKSDTKSLKSSRIGTAISEHYMTQAGFEQKFVNACEIALLCDESYVDLFWNKSSGDPIAVDPETGEPEMSGDALLRVHAPWNVARDMGMTVEQQDWHIISFRANKFDNAAMYPKFAQTILAMMNGDDMPEIPMNAIPDDSDATWNHLLIAKKSPAVPNGRYALMISGKIVLDSGLPYPEYPVERMTPSDVIDGPIGYTAANDILALEEVSDGLYSVCVTNQVTFGGQSIVGPEGANLKVTDLAKGVRYFELPPDMVDKLKPLQLTQTPAEVFNFLGLLNQKKEQQVGANSITRGQPEGQLSGASGAAMALIQTQAISFNSGIQRSYFKLLSGTMTKLIGILRLYADTPRIARIVGKSKASGLKEFKYTGKDLDSISSIVYELVNPISQSFGGRLTMAQDLLNAGQIKSPKQYINVVTTGQTDVMTEDDEADQMLILEENEALTEGVPLTAIITEFHADHIKSHMSVISSVEAKRDPALVEAVLSHVQEHIDLWQQASMTNPGLLMATGQQPLMPPPPMGMPGMPGMGAGPALPPPPQQKPEGKPGMQKLLGNGMPPVSKMAQEVELPNLPNVAGTDQKPNIPGVTDVTF